MNYLKEPINLFCSTAFDALKGLLVHIFQFISQFWIYYLAPTLSFHSLNSFETFRWLFRNYYKDARFSYRKLNSYKTSKVPHGRCHTVLEHLH